MSAVIFGLLQTLISYFGHTNIIKYCNRPFHNAHDMNKALTETWNDLIKPNDLVYHLGDFSFKTDRYINYLNGKIVLIIGNHDKKRYNKLFHSVCDSMSLKIKEFNCYLTHVPIVPESEHYKKGQKPDFTLLDRYDFIITGHVHEKWKTNGKNINVGVDVWDLKPVHIDELARFMRSLR